MTLEHAAQITIVPANEASWDDLQTVFGTRGTATICQCQRFKLQPKEAFSSFPVDERAHRLREQTNAGHPDADTTTGLVAYLDGEPVGWCAVEPRTGYPGLLRVYRVPWQGRAEDKADDGVWAVTCLFTRAGYRRRGISYALARAAVEFARDRGARALEGYPMITEPGQDITWDEILVGDSQYLRRRRVRGGQPSDPTPGRDADRLRPRLESTKYREESNDGERTDHPGPRLLARRMGVGRGRRSPPRRRPRRHRADPARPRVQGGRPLRDHVPGPRRRDHQRPRGDGRAGRARRPQRDRVQRIRGERPGRRSGSRRWSTSTPRPGSRRSTRTSRTPRSRSTGTSYRRRRTSTV